MRVQVIRFITFARQFYLELHQSLNVSIFDNICIIRTIISKIMRNFAQLLRELAHARQKASFLHSLNRNFITHED